MPGHEDPGAPAHEAMKALKSVTSMLDSMKKQVGGAKKRLRRRTKRRRKSRKARKSKSKRRRKSRRRSKRRRRR